AMGYYEEADVPFLGWLARNFNTFSSYHCSVMGPTFPNREYLYAATAMGVKTNAIPTPNAQNPLPTGYTWPTILDRLNAAGVSWACYGSDIPTVALFFHNIYEHPGKVRHITDYFVDAAAGILPSVVFLDPSFFTVGNDDHPARDIKLGQRFMMDTFLALAEGPHWPNSSYILTYDEHGGFYDHVPPPLAADERASADHCEDWGQLGFRVPTILASPFSRRGCVGTSLYDHTSILKLIEWRFGLLPLTLRDAGANNLAEVLDFENPIVDLPAEEPPFVPVHGAGLYCSVSQVPEATEGENPLEPVPDAPVPALAVPAGGAGASSQPHPELLALADAGFFGDLDMRERAKLGVLRD
ncbi:MAG: alkaline phosphatase family protein, partial [Candidatus Binatia bacterium]